MALQIVRIGIGIKMKFALKSSNKNSINGKMYNCNTKSYGGGEFGAKKRENDHYNYYIFNKHWLSKM